jgi:hypothetical protein
MQAELRIVPDSDGRFPACAFNSGQVGKEETYWNIGVVACGPLAAEEPIGFRGKIVSRPRAYANPGSLSAV